MAGQRFALIPEVPRRPKSLLFYFYFRLSAYALSQWCLQNLVL